MANFIIDPPKLKECVKKTSSGYSSEEIDVIFNEIIALKPLVLKMLTDMASQAETSGDYKDKFRANAYKKAIKELKPKTISPFYFILPAKKMQKMLKAIGVGGVGDKTAVKIYEFVYLRKTQVSSEEVVLAKRELSKIWGAGPVIINKWIDAGARSINDLKALEASGDVVLDNQQALWLKHSDDMLEDVPFNEASLFYELVELAVTGGKFKGSNRIKPLDPEGEVHLVGSFSRGQKTSGDVDILVLSDKIKGMEEVLAAMIKVNSDETREEFRRLKEISYRKGSSDEPTQVLDPEIYEKYMARPLEIEVGSIGSKQMLIVARNPLGFETRFRRVDIFLQPLSEKIPAIFSRKASGSYNKEIRLVAKKRGMILNEKGLWEKKEGSKLLVNIPLKSEEDLYDKLRIHFVDVDRRV